MLRWFREGYGEAWPMMVAWIALCAWMGFCLAIEPTFHWSPNIFPLAVSPWTMYAVAAAATLLCVLGVGFRREGGAWTTAIFVVSIRLVQSWQTRSLYPVGVWVILLGVTVLVAVLVNEWAARFVRLAEARNGGNGGR